MIISSWMFEKCDIPINFFNDFVEDLLLLVTVLF